MKLNETQKSLRRESKNLCVFSAEIVKTKNKKTKKSSLKTEVFFRWKLGEDQKRSSLKPEVFFLLSHWITKRIDVFADDNDDGNNESSYRNLVLYSTGLCI